jgi:sugar phosphate isomerase/epimerase
MAIKVGVQLYSVRDDCKRDLPHTLAEVAKIGYQGVEFAGYYDFDAATLRKMLDDNGLECCGTHIGLDALLGDNLQRTLEFHQTLRCPYLIVPGLPAERTASREAWLETARLFNDIAEQLKPYGFRTGYHNHWIEFQPFEDGTLPWDVFFSNTAPDVIMQIDTGNALHGGAHADAVCAQVRGTRRHRPLQGVLQHESQRDYRRGRSAVGGVF